MTRTNPRLLKQFEATARVAARRGHSTTLAKCFVIAALNKRYGAAAVRRHAAYVRRILDRVEQEAGEVGRVLEKS